MTGLTRIERIIAAGGIDAGITRGFFQRTPDDRRAVRAARALYRDLRRRIGYSSNAPLLTPPDAQVKLGKSLTPSYGLMLTPERGLMSFRDIMAAFGISGPVNLCPLASKGCAAACLSRSGQSGMRPAQRAQAVRTALLIAHPEVFGLILGAEIRAAVRKHGTVNLRLNVTSDIRWEMVAPVAVAALGTGGVRLYDYTAWSPADRKPSELYSLTYSAKEPSHTSDQYLTGILASGGTVAMPFTTRRGEALPATWHGFTVIDGDESDDRRSDPRGVVVGLRAKGHEWRKDNSAGFIRQA